MSTVVITPPEPYVELSEAKAHLRVEHSFDDGHITSLIDAATTLIDGPVGGGRRVFGLQTLELRLDAFPSCRRPIRLPFVPALQILSIKYDDQNGSEQTLGADIYALAGSHLVVLKPAMEWPSAFESTGSVRIRYEAGYAKVPEPIKVAVMMLVAQWYENREPASDRQQSELPFSVAALLAPYRILNV